MNLCGIGIPYEEQFTEKVAANRIVNCDFISNSQHYDSMDTAGTLESITNASNGILAAIKSGNPRDIDNNLIDKDTVRKELSLLGKSLVKIKRSAEKKIKDNPADYGTKFENRDHSVIEQVKIIEDLAKEMLFESCKEDLFLMFMAGKNDLGSHFNRLPVDLHQVIASQYLASRLQDLEEKQSL